MPIITKISVQARRKDLVNIFLDGKYSFSARTDDILIKQIKIGQEISSTEVSSLKKSKIDKNIFDLTFRFASSRLHSEKEISDYLIRKKQLPPDISKIIQRLKDLSVINDEEYAKWLASFRQKAGKSKKLIGFELRTKGVSDEIIKLVLSSLSEDELTVASLAVSKKLNRLSSRSVIDNQTKNKLIRYLLGLGFDYEISKKAIDLKLKKD